MRGDLKVFGLLLGLILIVGMGAGPVRAQTPSPVPALPRPLQPLRAWAMSLDGTILVVDSENRLFRLGSTDLATEACSEPLFAADPDDTIYLAGGITNAFVGSKSAGQTLVLDMLHVTVQTELELAGPIASDWSGRLYLASEGGIWRYNALRPAEPVELVVEGPQMGMGLVPTGLWAAQTPARLFVRLHDMSASPPHQHEFYRAYDLKDMSEAGISTGELGTLTRPAVAQMGVFISTLYSMSPFYSADKVLLFDSSAQTVAQWQPLDGEPAISMDGSAVYLLRRRGLWVLNGRDMSLSCVMPFVTAPPADLLLSPYGERLYLIGNGWLQVVETATLDNLGVQAVSPFPLVWLDEATNHRAHSEVPEFRIYAAPQGGDQGTVLVQVGDYGETYRSSDGGRSWKLMRSLTFPYLQETPPLSMSPAFAADHTLAGRFVQSVMLSTDGGDTWSAWQPPIAFVSDRTGNREIFTIAQDGSDPRQITADPAADEAPAWSPAWTYLAFQSDRSGNWDIYSMPSTCADAAGGEADCAPRQLTDDPADDLLPVWSPDGREIAFVSTRDGNPEIYVMDTDGGNQRRLTFDPAGDWRPAWLPDSAHLLFTSARAGNNDIYSLEVPAADAPPGSSEVDLREIVAGPSDERDVTVNADGNLLFLSDRDGVLKAYTLELSSPGATPRAMTDSPLPEGHPAWIDDQGYAALVSVERDGMTSVHRVCPVCDDEAMTGGTGFDGQPAWGPIWWVPDGAASREWLQQHQ